MKSHFSINEVVIVDIPSPGNLGGVYSDLILALSHSISLLGLKVRYERDLIHTKNPVIILGMYRKFINNRPNIKLTDNYYIFNLAPIHYKKLAWFDNYIEYVREHNLVDYSFRNIELLTHANKPRSAHLFDFGYIDLMPFRGIERSSNYLFYGKLNEDRIERLKLLQRAGLNLHVLHNVWGHERDIQIRMAKAIVNIGKYSPNILEIYRIWHSLCLGTPIYSDAGVDEMLAKKYSRYANLSQYLDIESFQIPPISPNVYKEDTSFIENVRSLIDFIMQ